MVYKTYFSNGSGDINDNSNTSWLPNSGFKS